MMAQKRSLTSTKEYQQPTVTPLLGDLAWDNGTPFNNLCPKQRYTSPTAIAMAQIMKYWKYPKELKEDIPAYTSYTEQVPDEKYEIDQINKGETYDWDNMLPVYNPSWVGINYNDKQANAVAKLVAHCGAAVQTIYTRWNSVALITPQAFTKYFGYDPDLARQIYRGSFSYSEWCKLIDQELIAKRPIIYSGFKASYSYAAFVCDGADGKGLYHINWGQGEDSNGYYDITILDRIDFKTDSPTSFLGFNKDCSMIIGLQPDNGIKDEPLIQVQALNVLPDDRQLSITKSERNSASDAFTLTYTSRLANYQPEDFDGLIDVGIKDDKGNYVPLSQESISIKQLGGISISSAYWYTDPLEKQIEYAFPVGTTTLYDIYSTDGGKTWQPCSYLEGAYPYEVVATETSLSVVPEKDDFKTTLQATSDFMVNRGCFLSYTMHNENSHDYFGTVKIYYSHTADFSSATGLNPDYVNIEAGGSTTHVIRVYPEEAGDLYVWLYDADHEKMLVDGQKFTVAEAPQLKFLSKSINVKEDTYERENAYYESRCVVMPVIDGDEAIVKYVVQNDGGSVKCNAQLAVDAFAKDEETAYIGFDKECVFEGNGSKTELEYRFKVSDLNGRRSFCCRFNFDNIYYEEMDFSQLPTYKLYRVDKPESSINISDELVVGYFSDSSTGISATPTANGIQITAGKGCLTLTTDKAQPIAIYNLAGQCVRRLNLQPNSTTTVSLPSGIYVIGKKKITVK